MFRRNWIEHHDGFIIVRPRHQSRNTSRDSIDTVNTSIRESGGGNSDAAAKHVHHVPFLASLFHSYLTGLISFNNGDNHIHSTLGPTVCNEGAPESCFEMCAQVTLGGIA
uniref:Uncharacterized protein n=1 Tax=Fusarium oxysporum (strain Fo5176) TaxID=660025 RepID=A0A0D2Y4Z3_FUSOF